MRNLIISGCMNIIKDSDLGHNEVKLAEIKYGLESIYLLISKLIIIFALAAFLNAIKELIIFLFLYNLIRMPSFGLHATKSWICLVSSTIIFIGGMYISLIFTLPIYMKVFLGIYAIIRLCMNAPADTHKKPIVSKKRREIYKFLTTILAIVMVFTSLFITDHFISNSLIMVLIIQTFMTSKIIYKFFNLPYDNYKEYILKNGLNKI
jgi:Membrane protein putatively involved in post-translational modification of the autoinducing quorum-sensing peptide